MYVILGLELFLVFFLDSWLDVKQELLLNASYFTQTLLLFSIDMRSLYQLDGLIFRFH